MKVSNYITILALLVLGSCTSSLYTGVEYDDLYYLPSDQPVATVRTPVKKQIAEGTLKSEEYYDNIYAADTLVSDEYSDAVDYDDAIISNGKNVNIYNYYDNYSYAGRLNRFYGNYFYPYWRDPFYYSWGYPSLSFRFGGYPYYSSFYNPFYYDPFYYDPFYSYYGGYYGGYYSRYYGYGYSPYSSLYYSPYNNWGYSSYIRDHNSSVTYGRRERQSAYSTRWNSSVSPTSASSRRDGYVSKGVDANRRSVTGTNTLSDGRRTVSTSVTKDAVNASDVKSNQNAIRQATPSVSSRAATRSSSTIARPEYNNVNRTYTPSYSNPRMSTRPSYNNSRVNSNAGSSGRSTYPETSRSSSNRNRSSASSYSSGQSRSSSSYSSPGSYSMPSRRSVSSGSGYSSGSSGSFSNSRSSSSYSGGGGSYSGGGYSSGSSGSSSGSTHSSSGGSSSGGRR